MTFAYINIMAWKTFMNSLVDVREQKLVKKGLEYV